MGERNFPFELSCFYSLTFGRSSFVVLLRYRCFRTRAPGVVLSGGRLLRFSSRSGTLSPLCSCSPLWKTRPLFLSSLATLFSSLALTPLSQRFCWSNSLLSSLTLTTPFWCLSSLSSSSVTPVVSLTLSLSPVLRPRATVLPSPSLPDKLSLRVGPYCQKFAGKRQISPFFPLLGALFGFSRVRRTTNFRWKLRRLRSPHSRA